MYGNATCVPRHQDEANRQHELARYSLTGSAGWCHPPSIECLNMVCCWTHRGTDPVKLS